MSGLRPRRPRAGPAGVALAIALLAGCADPVEPTGGAGYPEARREARVTVFHEVLVGDPYRWLENPGSSETRDWLRAQQRHARAQLRQAGPNGAFVPLLAELRGAVRTGVPQLANGRYAYRRADGGGAGLWLTLDPAEAGRRLVAAGDLPEQGELGQFALSPDGALLAWSFRVPGEQAWRWRIRDMQTGEDAEAELQPAAGSPVSWSADSRGVYYAREPVATRDGGARTLGVWYHRVGTVVARDVQVHAGTVAPGMRVTPRVTDDGRYLLVELTGDAGTSLHYQRLGRTPARGRVIRLLEERNGRYRFVGSTERTFYLLTTDGAMRGRIVAVDLDRPDPDSWRSVVAEGEFPLEEALLVGGRLALVYREPGQSRLFIHDLAGQQVREVTLPGPGRAGRLSGSYVNTELLYAWTDRRQPPVILRHDVNSGADGVFVLAAPASLPALDVQAVETAGGPLMLFRPEGDAAVARPLLLTVDAGADPALPPWQPEAVAWAGSGGAWALYEPGPEPQQAVAQLLATVESLLASGVAQAGGVAVAADGEDATLAAAAINRRPELFAAALLADAPLDLLRAEPLPTGWGDPAAADGFTQLYALSPYHQAIAGQCYPAIMLGAGPHWPPWHAWKYLAALQAVQSCARPLLWAGGETADAWRLLAREAGL